MSDHSELKKAAEACGPLPWRLIECGLTRLGVRDDHGFIAFMDISHPAKYGPCPVREAKARFIGHATPAAVLELIAENERLSGEDERKARIENEVLSVWEREGVPALRAECAKLKAENEALLLAVEYSVELFRKITSSDGSGHADLAKGVLRIAGKAVANEAAQPDPFKTCLECFGAGTISTGIEEASSTICNACDGTGKQQ